MSIKSKLRAELVNAMKSGDRPRRDAIRSVEAEIQTRRTAPGFSGTGEDDDFYEQIIGGYIKKMRKAATEYANLGERGEKLSRKLSFEVECLSQWLAARPPGRGAEPTTGSRDDRPPGFGGAIPGTRKGDGTHNEDPPQKGGRRLGFPAGGRGTVQGIDTPASLFECCEPPAYRRGGRPASSGPLMT